MGIMALTDAADLLQAIAALGWLVLAGVIGLGLRGLLRSRGSDLTRLSVGPSGLTAEFVSSKLDEASRSDDTPRPSPVAKSVVIQRLHRHADILARAHLLWVDDHPENNASIVELLSEYGVDVEIALANDEAFSRLTRHPKRYQVLISDMGRDNEPAAGAFPGAEFAVRAFEQTGLRTILFAGQFRPTSVPGLTPQQLVDLARTVDSATFGRTNRADELIHLILDVLERSPRLVPS
jgi:hypothetical protein